MSRWIDNQLADRLYMGNPAPEFKQQDFMVLATIRERKSIGGKGV